MRIPEKLAVTAVIAATTLMFVPEVATAHTEETAGPLELEIGFRDEPVYVGVPNAVFLALMKDDHPVRDIGDPLTVTLGFGDRVSDPIVFDPMEEPGQFQAPFVPSQAGAYTFTLSGSVDGEVVELSVTSGPKTFDEAQDIAGATFPQVLFPTNTELASRIEQESERTATALGAMASDVEAANDAASSAKTVGSIGIVLGALGLIVGAAALATRKRG
jgi:hypothetical protein